VSFTSKSSEMEIRSGSRASVPPANAAAANAQEFKPYRRFVSLVALGVIFVGGGYLLVSVGVSIYRQRNAVLIGDRVSAQLSMRELLGCWQELSDVSEALQKHLEKSHYLLGGYDQAEAQRWASEGAFWRNQWRAVGERCRLNRPAPARGGKELDEMVGAYRELEDTAAVYTKELLRFGREQAPRLDRIRIRINRIGKRLENKQGRLGDDHNERE
jgi:hypothetical protein